MSDQQSPTTDEATPPPLSDEPSVWYRSAPFDVRLDDGNLAVEVLTEREIFIVLALLDLAAVRLQRRRSQLSTAWARRPDGGDPS